MSKLRLIFAGSPAFAAHILSALLGSEHDVCAVYTQPDRPVGRGRQLQANPVKTLALAASLPVCQPLSLKTPTAHADLAAWQADLMVVAAYGLLLPAAMLDIPKQGCINVHASLLPRWRGASPIQQAILHGDAKTGVSIMQMAPGLDDGDVLHQAVLPLHATETAGELHESLAELGAQALLQTLNNLGHFQRTACSQDPTQVTFAPKLLKQQARIDWQKPALDLAREIRAYQPWPIAHTQLSDVAIRLWAAEVCEPTNSASPGTILAATAEGLTVACGSQALRILSLQLPGRKRLDFDQVFNAHRDLFQPGLCFE